MLVAIVAIVLFASSSLLRTGSAQDIGKAGGHPLNNEKRPSLADLLDQPDWGATTPQPAPAPQQAPAAESPAAAVPARPAAVLMPAQPANPAEVARTLQQLIDDRNRTVDGCGLLALIDEHNRETVRLRNLQDKLRVAANNNRRAAANVNQVLALGAKAAGGALNRAQTDARATQRDLAAADRECVQQINKINGIQLRLVPNFASLLQIYFKMQRLIEPSRLASTGAVLLNTIENAVAARPDFYEGRVLAAMSQIYFGNVDDAAGKAAAHLTQACQGFQKHQLWATPLAHECCNAYLLLDNPQAVEPFIQSLMQLPATSQHAVRCWLVANYHMILNRNATAKRFFDKSLAKVNAFKADLPLPPEVSPLLGDASLFYITTSDEKLRDYEKAKQILSKAAPTCDAWQVIRARAALEASEEKWDSALGLLAQCEQSCPVTLAEEVAQQQASYRKKETWTRSR